MHSTVVKADRVSKYPYLGIVEVTSLVVLFWGPDIGTVVDPGTSGNDLGEISEEWREDTFHPFTGQVILEN